MTSITVNLDEILNSEDEPNLRAIVLTKAAELLAERMHAEIHTMAQQQINQLVGDEIREIVRMTLAAPIQRTSPWGEKRGEPTTVLDIAKETLEKFISAPATKRDEFGVGNGRRGPATNLAELIEDVVNAALQSELRPAIKEARTQVMTKVREHFTNALAADLSKMH
jgi:hypothetical protein